MKLSTEPVDVEKYYAKKTIWDLPVGAILVPVFKFQIERCETGENRLVRLWNCKRQGEVSGDACRRCFLSARAAQVEGMAVEFLSRPLCKEANAVALTGSGIISVVLVDMSRKIMEVSIEGKDVEFSFAAVLLLVNSGYLKLVERKPVEV